MEEVTPPKEYKYTLRAEDFVKLFLADDEEFETLRSFLLNDEDNGISKHRGKTIIAETEIIGVIEIKNHELKDCNSVFFQNVKMGDIIIGREESENTTGTNFNFTGCELKQLIFEQVTIGNLNINDTFIRDILINKVECNDIHIYNCSIKGGLRINRISANLFFVKGCEISFYMNDRCVIKNVNIINTSVKKFSAVDYNTENLYLKNSSLDEISLYRSQIKLVTFDNIISKIKTEITKSDFERSNFSLLCHDFFIESSSLGQFIIRDSKILKFCIVQKYNATGSIFETIIIDLIFMYTILEKDSLLSFSKSSIINIQFLELSMLGNLFLKSISCDNFNPMWMSKDEFIIELDENEPLQSLLIEKFKMQLDHIYQTFDNEYKTKNKIIHFSFSSLGKTEFTDCPFGEYRIEFSNSKITDCFVSGGTLPANNVHIIDAETNSIKEHEQKASFYNQFKKIFEAQGDIYHSTQFQAKWAEEQRKELALRKGDEYKNAPKLWAKIKITFNSTSNDIVTLWLNMLSNLHGESYLRTLGAFFLIFIPIIYFILLRLMDLPINDKEMICKYFVFLNPAHSMKFINENKEITGAAIPIDFIGRIVVSYAIYQFVAAFRKHTKKQ